MVDIKDLAERKIIETKDGKIYQIGKVVNASDLKIDCKGCKSKFNNFFRFSLNPDSMKWDCQNCSSDFSMFCLDFETENEISVKIVVYMKRHGTTEQKIYGLINNSKFRELKEVESQ
jgi:hypothetical protein